MENKNDKRVSKELLTQISTDIFLIKEKLTDQEFKQIVDHMQLLFNSLNKDGKLTLGMLNKFEKLKMKYFRIAETLEVLYRSNYDQDYHEGCCDHYIDIH